MRILWGFRIHDRRKCPEQGPVLAICNHQTMLDPVIAGVSLIERTFRPLARESLNRQLPRLLRWGMRRYQVIFVDQENPGPSSLKAMLGELAAGGVAMIFPEGERRQNGHVSDFQPGVWLLIKRGKASILPMAIDGVSDVLPPGGPLRFRGRFELIMGDPIPSEDLIAMGRTKALAHLRQTVDDLRMEIRARIRTRTRGRWPRPGLGDEPLRLDEG
jgi:1-acyl-sn-glycerol-3-phosphate acyltransferase